MSNSRTRTTDRFLSALLSLIMIVGLLPVSLTANAVNLGEQFSFTVKSEEQPVQGASVSYSVTAGEDSLLNGVVSTEEDGIAFVDLAELEEMVGKTDIVLQYTVTADGFSEAGNSISLTNADDLKQNVDVNLTVAVPNTAQLSVTVTGNATVKLNEEEKNSITVEKDSQVKVEIIPAEGTYIKELFVGEEKTQVVKGEAYSAVLTVNDTLNISATVVEEFTVTVKNGGNGTVTLDGDEKDSLTVDKGTVLALYVAPSEGYHISSVTIDSVGQEIADPTVFSADVPVNADTVIAVEFVKVYTVIVRAGENGEAKITDPETAGGAVVVTTGTNVTVEATPNENYRVSEVLVNDVADSNVKGENDEAYEKTLEADQDYTLAVTFAPNKYSVEVNSPENGTLELSSYSVDYDGKTELKITPSAGYIVDDAVIRKAGSDDAGERLTLDLADAFTYKADIKNIREDKEIIVSFKIASTAAMTNVEWNYDKALRSGIDNQVYVFVKSEDFKVEFKSANGTTPIQINGRNNNTNLSNWFSSHCEISQNTKITSITLLYTADGDLFPGWHKVDAVSPSSPLMIVFDESAPTVKVEPTEKKDIYNADVTLKVSAEEEENFSGIASVEYWVMNGTTETQRDTLYTYTAGSADIRKTYGDRVDDAKIVVDASLNNADSIRVFVKVTDRAGNVSNITSPRYTLNINSTKPEIGISMKQDALHEEAEAGYYNAVRTAYVTFTDRADCFDKTVAEACIRITAVNAKGQPVKNAAKITWEDNDDIHKATVNFLADANYSFAVDPYTNKAGLQNDGFTSVAGTSIDAFTVDTKAPTGKVKVESTTWEDIASVLTFGIWKKDTVTAVATVSDLTSVDPTIRYYKSGSDAVLNDEELERLYAANPEEFKEEPIPVSSDEKFVIYVRLLDKAGNHAYISTNGIIYDSTKSAITLSVPDANNYGYYNDSVDVTVTVNEKPEGATVYSGIKKISYVVIKDNDEAHPTQSQTLYTFSTSNPTYAQLTETKTVNFTVDAKKNNSDNICVIVTAVDNAGNEYSKEVYLAICTDKPKAKLSFDNNDVQNTDRETGRGYYNKKRTATLEITDRADVFDSSFVQFRVDADITAGEDDPLYTVGAWRDNGNVHTAEITFAKDANYEWSFSYTNKAQLSLDSTAVDAGTSKTPYRFTVDTGKPVGTVTVAENTWDTLLEVLTFGLYHKVTVNVTATGEDATSPLKIEYYRYNGTTALSEVMLEELYQQDAQEVVSSQKKFKPYEAFSVEADEMFTVYLRITDMANNYCYISSDGNILDMVKSRITLTPDLPNENGVYNKDVNIDVAVVDPVPYSGIQSIDYAVVKDGDTEHPTQSGNLFTFSPETAPAQSELVQTKYARITVDSALNNSSSIRVTVTTVDNAGNENAEFLDLDIDITAPVIEVTYDNNNDNSAAADYDGAGYFAQDRTATVVITERSSHFDPARALQGISVTAKDGAAEPANIADAYEIGQWRTMQGATPDEDTHTVTIHFAKDANYTFGISYTDNAGNENNGVDPKDSVAPYVFTVDTVKPYGTVTAKSAEGREVSWNDSDFVLGGDLIFGFWSKQNITVSSTSGDATSPIAKVEYYKVKAANATDGTTALTGEELDGVAGWTAFTGLNVVANEQFTVYLKLTDRAGNYAYLRTDGLIVDDQAPIEEMIAPEITVTPEQPVNGIYNRNVKVSIQVRDPMVGGTYSGLKTVKYRVYNMGTVTQSGTLYSFTVENPKQSDLVPVYTGEIVVDSTKNNSNDVVIEVSAEDNAQNTSKDRTSIRIDITAPAIDVSYDNNSARNGKYFKANRTATIVVTERNFDPEGVRISITNTDGVIPKITEWVKTEGTENLDDTQWTTTLKYDADGDYTFDITCKDLAGNACEEVNYGESVRPTAFTIDKTIPVIKVVYDNNDAQNTNYYKAKRTAKIVITEHNFSERDVETTISASDDGKEITAPSVSSWTGEEDVHSASVEYSEDAFYRFDIAYSDLAGNAAAAFAEQTFYVDQTAPSLEIAGVKNESANNGDVIPVITYSDTNINMKSVTITLNGANRKEVALDGNYSDIHNGQIFTFNNFPKEQETDDIYTLFAKLTDMAGNSSTKTIVFSVNRFGSTYALSSDAQTINGTYIKDPIDVILTETNVDALNNVKITMFKNNETIELESGKDFDYTIDVAGGNGQWYHYTYTVFKKNFTDDGVYRLTVYSEDTAGNVAENTLDTKNTAVNFGVDNTKPTIMVINLEDGVTYALENMTVNMSLNDNLQLSEARVYLDGSGDVYKSWNAEEIAGFLSSNKDFSFDVSGDSTKAHKVRIVCVDAAGNESELEIKDFFVTKNLWVRYYNNKALFFGSIGGVVVLAGLLVFLTVFKRKKKEAN